MGQEQSSGQKPDRTSEESPANEIVVVKSGRNKTKDQQINREPDLVTLKKIPSFSPLMKSSLSAPYMTDFDVMNRLDARPARTLCLRYQEHLRLCAEAVAFDQDAMAHRLKELESQSDSLLRHVTERHKKLQSQVHLIETVVDVKRNIDRVEMTLQQIVPLMDKLNSLLSEEDRMEPFLKPDK